MDTARQQQLDDLKSLHSTDAQPFVQPRAVMALHMLREMVP